MDELGYVQNQLAVSMVTGQTKTIMMIVPDFTNDFNGAVIQGAETYLKEHGYTILVSSSADFKDADYEALRQRFFRMVDGILAVPSPSDIFNYNSWGKPAVLIDCWRPENDYYTVEINNAWGNVSPYRRNDQKRTQTDCLCRRDPGSEPGRPASGWLSKSNERL